MKCLVLSIKCSSRLLNVLFKNLILLLKSNMSTQMTIKDRLCYIYNDTRAIKITAPSMYVRNPVVSVVQVSFRLGGGHARYFPYPDQVRECGGFLVTFLPFFRV